MSHLPLLNELVTQPQLRELVIQQTRKDLSVGEEELPDRSVMPDLVDFVNDVSVCIRKRDGHSSSWLPSVLYRVDVPEKLVRQLDNGARYYDQLAELIVRRELQKVLIRLHYKSS